MTRRRVGLLLLAVTALCAGCGTAAGPASTSAPATGPPSLATSLVTATATWAVAVVGGPAAQHNNFWQLFIRPAPAGTTTALLAAGTGSAQRLLAAWSTDSGAHWAL